MGWACGTHGRDEKCIQILIGKSEGKSHLGDVGVHCRTILKLKAMRLRDGFFWLRTGSTGGVL